MMLFKSSVLSLLVVVILQEATATLECAPWEVVVIKDTCEGTCDDPTCLSSNNTVPLVDERCGCKHGTVRNEQNECVRLRRCPNWETLPTQCQFEAFLNNETKCNDDGSFVSKQNINGITKCVHPTSGLTIPGKIMKNGTDIDCDDLSACQSAWKIVGDKNQASTALGLEVQCMKRGKLFRPKQCWRGPNGRYYACRCVVPQTGDVISGSPIFSARLKLGQKQNCRYNQLTECQKDFWKASKSNAGAEEKEPLPVCSGKGGNYPHRECDEDGICFCRDPISGTIVPGKGKDIKCEVLTRCQKGFLDGSRDWYECDEDTGNFKVLYCNHKKCECRQTTDGFPYLAISPPKLDIVCTFETHPVQIPIAGPGGIPRHELEKPFEIMEAGIPLHIDTDGVQHRAENRKARNRRSTDKKDGEETHPYGKPYIGSDGQIQITLEEPIEIWEVGVPLYIDTDGVQYLEGGAKRNPKARVRRSTDEKDGEFTYPIGVPIIAPDGTEFMILQLPVTRSFVGIPLAFDKNGERVLPEGAKLSDMIEVTNRRARRSVDDIDGGDDGLPEPYIVISDDEEVTKDPNDLSLDDWGDIILSLPEDDSSGEQEKPEVRFEASFKEDFKPPPPGLIMPNYAQTIKPDEPPLPNFIPNFLPPIKPNEPKDFKPPPAGIIMPNYVQPINPNQPEYFKPPIAIFVPKGVPDYPMAENTKGQEPVPEYLGKPRPEYLGEPVPEYLREPGPEFIEPVVVAEEFNWFVPDASVEYEADYGNFSDYEETSPVTPSYDDAPEPDHDYISDYAEAPETPPVTPPHDDVPKLETPDEKIPPLPNFVTEGIPDYLMAKYHKGTEAVPDYLGEPVPKFLEPVVVADERRFFNPDVSIESRNIVTEGIPDYLMAKYLKGTEAVPDYLGEPVPKFLEPVVVADERRFFNPDVSIESEADHDYIVDYEETPPVTPPHDDDVPEIPDEKIPPLPNFIPKGIPDYAEAPETPPVTPPGDDAPKPEVPGENIPE